VGAPRSGDGATGRHEGVAGQDGEGAALATGGKFVRHFLWVAGANRTVIVAKPTRPRLENDYIGSGLLHA
jgi:hypothetical protein